MSEKFDPILAPFESALRKMKISVSEIEEDGLITESILNNPDITSLLFTNIFCSRNVPFWFIFATNI